MTRPRHDRVLSYEAAKIDAGIHSTFMGHRAVRTADGGTAALHYGRCTCGWEGPSRAKRPDAVMDGQAHLLRVQAGGGGRGTH